MRFFSKIGYKNYLKFIWVILALILFGLSQFPSLIEQVYSPYFFHFISIGLRFITQKIPVAIGEWVFVILIIILIIKSVEHLYKNKYILKQSRFWRNTLFGALLVLVKLYVVFELIWGFNYQKPNPSTRFHLSVPNGYTQAQMDQLSLELIQELNQTRAKLTDSLLTEVPKKDIFDAAVKEYDQIVQQYPFLKYEIPCVKFAQFPLWGDYLGYLAFYQPITGEAIVRPDLPLLTLPFTITHEIAHQIGYASETEANFIAYVIGAETKDSLFHYSMLLQLFSYAQMAELQLLAEKNDFKHWEQVVKRNKHLLAPNVLEDRRKIKAFFMERSGRLIPASVSIYDQFLQLNKQVKGIQSYNDVLLWALAYRAQHTRLLNK
jgi:hypothetical protein